MATKRLSCPLCTTKASFVKPFITAPLYHCVRHHKFYCEWGTVTDRNLVLAVDTDGHKAGERFAVPDDCILE